MIGDEDQFISLEVKEGGIVMFGDNAKDKIVRIGKVLSLLPLALIMCYLLKD